MPRLSLLRLARISTLCVEDFLSACRFSIPQKQLSDLIIKAGHLPSGDLLCAA
jgi:hypothetical protein